MRNFFTATFSALLAYATDIFYGQWCPYPRSCRDLVNCVNGQINEARIYARPAFLQYLEDAPQLITGTDDFTDDPTKCGDLREYFEYDRDYSDDDRICEEVKDLRVSR